MDLVTVNTIKKAKNTEKLGLPQYLTWTIIVAGTSTLSNKDRTLKVLEGMQRKIE